ncbi:unnamed protein product, partial [Iphiclides podalirius]
MAQTSGLRVARRSGADTASSSRKSGPKKLSRAARAPDEWWRPAAGAPCNLSAAGNYLRENGLAPRRNESLIERAAMPPRDCRSSPGDCTATTFSGIVAS